MDERSRLLSALEALTEVESEAPPTIHYRKYFEGNRDEECLAPNQWGFGRPSIAELYERFEAIEARSEVQCVLVGMHFFWSEALDDDRIWPAAENVHIYASADEDDVRSWIVGLESDGLYIGWPYGEHPLSPKPMSGFQVYSVCWD